MNLDEQYLADTPLFAQLVRDRAVGMAGALELLSDDYQPPQPPFLRLEVENEEGAEEERKDESESTIEESVESSVEVDAEGYPAIVKVAPVAPPTPPKGVKLIRPRSLSDMPQASS